MLCNVESDLNRWAYWENDGERANLISQRGSSDGESELLGDLVELGGGNAFLEETEHLGHHGSEATHNEESGTILK